MNIIEQDNEYIMNTYSRQPLCIASGNGAVCVDINGKEYIDMGSGIGVNSLGYCDAEWSEAVSNQARILQHTSNLYYTAPAATLSQVLCKITGYNKLFLANSGAEANEAAIKIARKYSCDKYGEESNRHVIITLKNSFHGRTITTLSATGQDVFHKHFFPFTEGFVHVQPNDIDQLKSAINDKVCAVMFEPIQGEGGVNALDYDYLQAVAKLCESMDIMLIADEVQTGVGRTGKALCSEHFDIKPNIVSLAKGLGGGLPIGAVLADDLTCNVLKYGDHGTTFGGNPVSCAGANVVVRRVLNHDFLDEITKKGEYLKKQLETLPEVESVSGIGLMLGIKLCTKSAGEVVKSCIDSGLILLTAKEKIRLLPPLIITYEQINDAITILRKELS